MYQGLLSEWNRAKWNQLHAHDAVLTGDLTVSQWEEIEAQEKTLWAQFVQAALSARTHRLEARTEAEAR